MDNLSSFLESISQNSDFNAELSKRGGYITFSNSGRRGSIKSFQIGLDSILQTLKDILMHLDVFGDLVKYDETSWRDNGAAYFTDPVANATSTVQTKPLFSTLSKVIIWGNQPRLNTIDPDESINLDKDSLTVAIEKLESVANSFAPKDALREKNVTFPNQQIFYGAPGTGKSHTVNEVTELQPQENIFRTTFHPDSDYSTFVGCYKPSMTYKPVRNVAGDVVKKDGKEVFEKVIAYSFCPQSFTKAYLRAWQTEENVFLIIEEINRGNCAQIFGDLFQLLDRKDDGFSEYPIKADNDLASYIAEQLSEYARTDIPESVKNGEELILPSNLYIWATMNTSDQSLFPIDSAFKRRWDWQYTPISDGKQGWKVEVNGIYYDWWDFLQKINEQIGSTTNSEDKKLGYYFCKATKGIINAETFVGKVIFYIWNDVFKDFAEEAGDLFKDTDGSLLSFNKFYTVGEDGKVTVLEDKISIFLHNLGVEETYDDLESDNPDTMKSTDLSSSSFKLNGEEFNLGQIAKNVVLNYAKNNPSMTSQDIRNYFVNLCKGIGIAHVVETEDEYHLRDDQPSQKRTVSEITIPYNNEKLYVSTQWKAKNKNDNFMKFMEIVNNNGLGVISQ